MNARLWTLALLGAAAWVGSAPAADAPHRQGGRISDTFGALQAASPETARTQALDWLKTAGKNDAGTLKAFDVIWAQADRPVLDRVTETLTLGDTTAAKLLKEISDPANTAPLELPAILQDHKKPAFYRSNLALAYGKALSNRKAYEEALGALKAAKAEQVVDPSTYLFHRAVAEHALMMKEDATKSIVRLLDDGVDVPERYRLVAVLMAFDMGSWQEKDLGEIARKMNNIERRLELSRGGPHTQKIQKDVIARLDEMIKKLENQCNGCCDCNGGGCPNGGNNGGATPKNPLNDSKIVKHNGAGKVSATQLAKLAQEWGKLPEKKRAEAMQELTRDLPPKYREVVENYFRKLAQNPQDSTR
ncbi:MAG TPA: hypothetical protein VGY58_24240 [Gemmataceae bacterium]|jgi:hypothetical protein|nr:hypothetical protein [Gemmataceae bacterium]